MRTRRRREERPATRPPISAACGDLSGSRASFEVIGGVVGDGDGDRDKVVIAYASWSVTEAEDGLRRSAFGPDGRRGRERTSGITGKVTLEFRRKRRRGTGKTKGWGDFLVLLCVEKKDVDASDLDFTNEQKCRSWLSGSSHLSSLGQM